MKTATAFAGAALSAVAALFLVVGQADAQLKPKASKAPAEVAVDDRIKKLLDAEDLHYDVTDAGVFKLMFNVGESKDSRSQLVFVNSQTETYGEFEIREVWSIAHKAPEKSHDADFYRKLLQDTQAKKIGGWSLITTEGQEYVVFTVKIAADIDGKALRDVLEIVLETADEREKAENAGADDF
ncbi:MAG TPA: hypothetical protein VGE52_22455 [Pirellulales bacterium]